MKLLQVIDFLKAKLLTPAANGITTFAKSGLQGFAGLLMNMGIPLGIRIRNIYKATCMRRAVDCNCPGCGRWNQVQADKSLEGFYTVEDMACANAWVAWEVEIPNLTTTVGLNDLLTQYFKGAGYTAAWYVGLVDNAGFSTYAAADTLASHGGWTEAVGYSGSNRITLTLGTVAAGSVNNSGSVAAFGISGTATIRGAFVTQTQVRATTTGILYGEADFGAARAVLNGDTLNVTVTLTAS